MREDVKRMGDEISLDDWTFLMKKAKDRAQLLPQVKRALLAGDEATAGKLMREYCGIKQEEKEK